MNAFSHGFHGKWYCPWACMHDGSGSGVMQDGSHTLDNRLPDMQPWFIAFLFDIGHPMLRSIDTIQNKVSGNQYHCGLKFRAHLGHDH